MTLLRVVPCDLKTANEFVRKLHRHSRPVVGHKFAVGVEACTRAADGERWALVGVAIVGRPVAPRLDNGKAAELTRLCTDGTRNACSMLYGAARRAARALGHEPDLHVHAARRGRRQLASRWIQARQRGRGRKRRDVAQPARPHSRARGG